MRFDIDVLIVFADTDNETGANKEPGWVDQFKKFLVICIIFDQHTFYLLFHLVPDIVFPKAFVYNKISRR